MIAGLASGAASLAPAQDRFGADEQFDSEFYGDLRARRGEAAPRSASEPGALASPVRPAASAAAAPQAKISQSVSVPPEFIPWSGNWWTRSAADLVFRKFQGGLSPLEKYDSLVLSLYGKLPGAAAWEADPVNDHNYGARRDVDWGGHCNGLAAASILVPEPRKPFEVPLGDRPAKVRLKLVTGKSAPAYMYSDGEVDYERIPDPGRSMTITIADMKGLLSEAYQTSKTQQFTSRRVTGTRFDGGPSERNTAAFRDIEPHFFHWLLQEFVRKNGMAIVVEVNPDKKVNNHPLYKFESDAHYHADGKKYSVTTKCYLTNYQKDANAVGTVTMTKTYRYELYLDANGRVTRGEWIGESVNDHPDFVWIPTADAPPYGTFENPAVNGDFVRWIYSRYSAPER